jgi:hypothetical protein
VIYGFNFLDLIFKFLGFWVVGVSVFFVEDEEDRR